jgi:hypothetical protein
MVYAMPKANMHSVRIQKQLDSWKCSLVSVRDNWKIELLDHKYSSMSERHTMHRKTMTFMSNNEVDSRGYDVTNLTFLK